MTIIITLISTDTYNKFTAQIHFPNNTDEGSTDCNNVINAYRDIKLD